MMKETDEEMKNYQNIEENSYEQYMELLEQKAKKESFSTDDDQ